MGVEWIAPGLHCIDHALDFLAHLELPSHLDMFELGRDGISNFSTGSNTARCNDLALANINGPRLIVSCVRYQ